MNKRKVPDSSYMAPVTYNRSINHQHTNSLPIATPLIQHPSPHVNPILSGSSNNLTCMPYDQSTAPIQYGHHHQHQQYATSMAMYSSVKQEPVVSSHKALSKLHQNTLSHSVGQHVKTFSLPVDMGPMNGIKEAPLPEGWSSAKTPTGQVYFIKYTQVGFFIQNTY